MDNNKKASSAFNRVAKGALAGAGIAIVGAAILPVVTVSAPVVIIGGVIGAWINSRNKP
ncbi:MAG: hypothetical protein PSY14_07275 [bacterium]|nr:hypothetical protein [bacterium]